MSETPLDMDAVADALEKDAALRNVLFTRGIHVLLEREIEERQRPWQSDAEMPRIHGICESTAKGNPEFWNDLIRGLSLLQHEGMSDE